LDDAVLGKRISRHRFEGGFCQGTDFGWGIVPILEHLPFFYDEKRAAGTI
jgi:hypothetical protein